MAGRKRPGGESPAGCSSFQAPFFGSKAQVSLRSFSPSLPPNTITRSMEAAYAIACPMRGDGNVAMWV